MRKIWVSALRAGWVVLLLAVSSPASLAGPEYAQPSTDVLPRGCWQMDAMAWLAGEGWLPPFTARDFLQSRTFTR
ncbi:MAG: hypothetical protein WHZ52_04615, partial [Armatimonadota bacterium]